MRKIPKTYIYFTIFFIIITLLPEIFFSNNIIHSSRSTAGLSPSTQAIYIGLYVILIPLQAILVFFILGILKTIYKKQNINISRLFKGYIIIQVIVILIFVSFIQIGNYLLDYAKETNNPDLCDNTFQRKFVHMYDRYYCIHIIAYNAENEEFCDKIPGDYRSRYTFSRRDNCYFSVAVLKNISTTKDVSICDKISYANVRTECVTALALKSYDEQICLSIDYSGYDAKSECVLYVAWLKNNSNVCSILQENSKECISDYHSKKSYKKESIQKGEFITDMQEELIEY